MHRDSRSFTDTYQSDLAFFEFFDELRFICYRQLCLCVGMCEDNRQSTRVTVGVRIYDKASAAVGITFCLLLVPLIVCHHNVMTTLLRYTFLWRGVRVLESDLE